LKADRYIWWTYKYKCSQTKYTFWWM